MKPWPENLADKPWRRDEDRCGFVTGRTSPIGDDYQFVTDQTLCALAHTDHGKRLAEIVSGAPA